MMVCMIGVIEYVPVVCVCACVYACVATSQRGVDFDVFSVLYVTCSLCVSISPHYRNTHKTTKLQSHAYIGQSNNSQQKMQQKPNDASIRSVGAEKTKRKRNTKAQSENNKLLYCEVSSQTKSYGSGRSEPKLSTTDWDQLAKFMYKIFCSL